MVTRSACTLSAKRINAFSNLLHISHVLINIDIYFFIFIIYRYINCQSSNTKMCFTFSKVIPNNSIKRFHNLFSKNTFPLNCMLLKYISFFRRLSSQCHIEASFFSIFENFSKQYRKKHSGTRTHANAFIKHDGELLRPRIPRNLL